MGQYQSMSSASRGAEKVSKSWVIDKTKALFGYQFSKEILLYFS